MYARSIASWMLAIAACGAWYEYDKRKAREFSASELRSWNEAVLRKHPTKSPKQPRSDAAQNE